MKHELVMSVNDEFEMYESAGEEKSQGDGSVDSE